MSKKFVTISMSTLVLVGALLTSNRSYAEANMNSDPVLNVPRLENAVNVDNSDKDDETILRDYREYDTYKVYDQGITKKWNWLSKPYFVISVAKGASYSVSKTVTATISGSISGNYPSGAKSSILNAFGMNASGSKSVSVKITLSGPSGNASSRDFYYRKGTHRHSVKVVQEHRSNWDGVQWTKTFNVYVDVPAIKNYSEDH